MNDLKLIQIEEDIKQDQFPEYMIKKGWNCLRLIKKNYKIIDTIVNKIKEDSWNSCSIRKMRNLGKPDFFIHKNGRFYFCEFKSRTDIIRPEQLSWMMDHIDYPKAIAFVYLKKRKINKLFFDEDTINKAIQDFIERNTKKVSGEYQKYYGYDNSEFFREVIEKKLKETIEKGNFTFDPTEKSFLDMNNGRSLYFYYKK
jgi:hypothetical protein